MKITCQACAAKYTIADEKVSGKVVKIRCKKCGATIVVNGNEASAGPASGQGRAFDYAGQGGAPADEWTVNVADGDQRTMTSAQIADACRAGVVTDETFCWKDGMGDWLALRDIEELYALCVGTKVAPGNEIAGDEGTTKIQDGSPALFAAAGGRPAYAQAPAPTPAAGRNGGFAEAAPLAARRAGGRGGADLFGGAAQAGSEEDVMTSAPTGMPRAHDDPGGLTGARNENSVLFSLNALTSAAGPPPPSPGGNTEASGLIDIRQLSNQLGMGDDRRKRSRIDDIMNLGGGGAFAPAMGAPVLSAPPIEEYAPSPDATAAGTVAMPSQGKSRALILGAIGAGFLVIAGAIGAAVMLMRGSDTDAEKAAASASAAAASASALAMAAASTAPADTSTAAATAAATETAAPTPSAPTSTATAAATAAPDVPATPKPAAAPTTPKPATPAAAPPPAAPATPPPAAPAAPAAAAVDQPFNMGEAKAKLAGIAGGVQSCKKGDTTGSGRVVVTFAPNGGAQTAVVSGGLEGTPTGACVAGRFRGARVPPFSGSPFSVAKSFTIN